jgi:Family of unknown function (DUF6515)/Bacterial SH3 domain
VAVIDRLTQVLEDDHTILGFMANFHISSLFPPYLPTKLTANGEIKPMEAVMKNSGHKHLVSTFLLVTLLSGGLTLLGSNFSAAETDPGTNKGQWQKPRELKPAQQENLREEQKPDSKVDRQDSRHPKERQTLTTVPKSERKELRREVKPAVATKTTRDNRTNGDARGPAVRTVTRPTITRNQTVGRTVSQPGVRTEVHDYRRPHSIQRPEVRRTQHNEVIVKTLPHGSRTLVINRERYHVHNGRYYRYTPRGYLLVRPPLGFIIADLPFGNFRVAFGGLDYFVWDNVFYRHTLRGYEVVATPAGYEETDYGPIRVESALLNIRTGPGLGYEVIGRLQQGDLLVVTAVSPDWYYVLLPNGEYGWIMSRHTSFIAQG